MPANEKPKPSVLETFLNVREALDRPGEESRFLKSNILDSLARASVPTLQNFVLSRLASAANLKKDMDVIFQEIVDQLSEARLAELLLHHAQRNTRKTTRPERSVRSSRSGKEGVEQR